MLEIYKKPDVSRSWSQTAYEKIYAGEGIRQTDSFYLWLLKLMRIEAGQRLLDISCGEGSLVRLAKERGVTAYGADMSETALLTAVHEARTQQFAVGDAQDLPFADASFDYVANIGSLEHYLDPVKGILEIRRVLSPHGLACILLPNVYSIVDNVWYAYRFGRTFQDVQPIQRYAARYDWQDLLEANGLHVDKTVKYEREWPTQAGDWQVYLHHPKSLVKLLLTPLIPLNLASCFVYLCRRRDRA